MERTRAGGRGPRRLLFATDYSAASRAALLAVAGLAVGGATRVVVLHVDDGDEPGQSSRLVRETAGRLVALAVDARAEVRRSEPGQVAAEIAAVAAENGAGLVVLGSRGRSDLGGLLLGRVSRDVVERVGCPVLVVRAGRRAGGRRRRVLVSVAGDEDLSELVQTTAAVAGTDAQVLVLQLLATDDGDLAPPTRVVEEIVSGLRRCGVRARGAGRRTPGESARAALDYGADLIVMGSRRLPGLVSASRLAPRSA